MLYSCFYKKDPTKFIHNYMKCIWFYQRTNFALSSKNWRLTKKWCILKQKCWPIAILFLKSMAQKSVILLLSPARCTPFLTVYPRFQITSPSATWSWPFELARDCASYFSLYLLSLLLSSSHPSVSLYLFASLLCLIFSLSLCKIYVAQDITRINFAPELSCWI